MQEILYLRLSVRLILGPAISIDFIMMSKGYMHNAAIFLSGMSFLGSVKTIAGFLTVYKT